MEEKYYGASRTNNGNNNFYNNADDCINSIKSKEISSMVLFYYPRSKSDLIEELNRTNSHTVHNTNEVKNGS